MRAPTHRGEGSDEVMRMVGWCDGMLFGAYNPHDVPWIVLPLVSVPHQCTPMAAASATK